MAPTGGKRNEEEEKVIKKQRRHEKVSHANRYDNSPDGVWKRPLLLH